MKNKKRTLFWVLIITIIVILLWIGNWLLVSSFEKSNEIGETFGIVNSLFAGLAFIGVFYTILLQKQELRETKEEFITQNETLRKQRFENTFFQMVNLHHEIIDKISFEEIHKTQYEKRQLLNYACKELKSKIEIENSNLIEKTLNGDNESELTILSKAYISFHDERFSGVFSHYFRNLYHIFKYIYQNKDIEKQNKQFYASLLRAQLSDDELYLIFYNSMVEGYGNSKLLFLVKEFDILKNLNFEKRITDEEHIELFEKLKSEVKNPFV